MSKGEPHRLSRRRLQRTEVETIIYLGREDDNHKEGVGIRMSKNAARALIEWTAVSARIIQNRCNFQRINFTTVHIYAFTGGAVEQMLSSLWVMGTDTGTLASEECVPHETARGTGR